MEDKKLEVSNVLNDTGSYDSIKKIFGIEGGHDSQIFHDIEDFIVDKMLELKEELEEGNATNNI